MDWEFILIQAIGLLGNIVVISSMQFNSRRVVLLAQAIACVLWSVHYGALGAMTAVFTNFIGLARSLVFYNNEKPWAKSRVWLWVFLAAFILNSAFTWEGWVSILPAMGMCANTAALWSREGKMLRRFYLLSSPPWLVYNLLCGSYTCFAVEICAFISYIVAIFRFDIRKKEAV